MTDYPTLAAAAVCLALLVVLVFLIGVSRSQMRRLYRLIRHDQERADRMSGAIDRSLAFSREQVSSMTQRLESDMEQLRRSNDEKIGGMQDFVSEKLDRRLDASIRLITNQLGILSGSIGELKNLSGGIDDLRHMMTGTNARGAWGEFRLGQLIRQILSPSQYIENTAVEPNSSLRVEYAVRLPGDDGDVLLPIDSKFPQADYLRLLDAAQKSAKPDDMRRAKAALERTLQECAKDIRDKYVRPPHTTPYAILFLPTEGLYCEAAAVPGLTEALQQKYSVICAGPSTLTGLLMSLETGFRSYTLQKKSDEILSALVAVKKDMEAIAAAHASVAQRLDQAYEAVHQAENASRKLARAIDRIDITRDT